MIELSPKDKEKMIEDIAMRFEEFRLGMGTLVQKHNVFPDAQLDLSPYAISTGIVLKDAKYKDAQLDEQARILCVERQNEKEAKLADTDVSVATQNAVSELLKE